MTTTAGATSDTTNLLNAAGLLTSKDVTTNTSNSGGTNTESTVDTGQDTTSTTNNTGSTTNSTTNNTGSTNTIVNSGSVNSTSSTSKTSNSGRTDTQQLQISQEGVDRLVQSMLGGSQGLAAVTSGQHASGMYNTTTNQMLTDDLLARVSGEIASRTGVLVNKTGASSSITKNSSQQVIGGSTITNTTGPSSSNTSTTTGPSSSTTDTVSGPRTITKTGVVGPTTSSSEQYQKAPINPATALAGLTAAQFIAKYGKSMYDALGGDSLFGGSTESIAAGLGSDAAGSAIAGGAAAGAADAAAIGSSTAAEVGAAMGADAAGSGATSAGVDALWSSVMGESAAAGGSGAAIGGGVAAAGGVDAAASLGTAAGEGVAEAAAAGEGAAAAEGGAAAAGEGAGMGASAYVWPVAAVLSAAYNINHDKTANSDIKSADYWGGFGTGHIVTAYDTGDATAVFGPLQGTAQKISSGWIICTELHRQGRLNSTHYIYGSRAFAKYDDQGKKGYYIWAVPSVRHLRKYPNSWYSKFLEKIFCARAEYLAAVGGYRKAKKTLFGALVTHSTYAFCWILSRTIARNYDTPNNLDTLTSLGVSNGRD